MRSRKLNLSATLLSTSLVFTLLLAGAQTSALAVGNGLGRTPPMGWNSWNKFACNDPDMLEVGNGKMTDACQSHRKQD